MSFFDKPGDVKYAMYSNKPMIALRYIHEEAYFTVTNSLDSLPTMTAKAFIAGI